MDIFCYDRRSKSGTMPSGLSFRNSRRAFRLTQIIVVTEGRGIGPRNGLVLLGTSTISQNVTAGLVRSGNVRVLTIEDERALWFVSFVQEVPSPTGPP
jgi:hypothetical protein